jgi:TolB protein
MMNFDNLLQERPAPPRRRRWPWLAALALAALVFVACDRLDQGLRPAPAPAVPVGRILFSNGLPYLFRSGDPAPVEVSVPLDDDMIVIEMALSPQGDRIAFTTVLEADIYVVDVDGSNLVRLTSERENYTPAWSPDGQRIVFTSWSEDATEPEDDEELGFYVVNADGSGLERLPIPADLVGLDAVWSPDGQKLAYEFLPQGGASGDGIINTDIAVINLDGSGFIRLNIDQTAESVPAWSPDGTTIAYVVAREYNADDEEIWTIAADGSNRRRLTDNDVEDIDPVWSPDGRHLAFTRRTSTSHEIFLMGADGSDQRPLTRGNSPAWAP